MKVEHYYKPDSKTLREEPQVFTRWIDPTIEKLQQENKQLKEELENIKDFNNKLQASKDRLDKDDYNLAHILTELEEWCNDGIKDELIVFDYGTEIIGEPIKIHIASYEMVLDKIQKLKEKYK